MVMKVGREKLLTAVVEKMGSIVRGMFTANQFPIGETKVGGQQVRILFYLARKHDGVSVKELAEKLNVTSGAVSQFMDVLVEKNLVKREEDLNDRRLLRMRLTKQAKSKFADFKRYYFATVSRTFDSLSDEEIVTLLELLNKIGV
ncbi:MAG: MarR family transcriptional regulator [Dehalococcoidia bacterium]|jgi:DNA-binding MarR family transcriptional regulator